MSIEKILIIDSDRLERDFIADLLCKKHFEAKTVADGREALQVMQETGIDMVIAEMQHPQMQELAFLREVLALHPTMCVVIIATAGQESQAIEAVRLGAFSYLLKPFSAEALETLIDKARQHNVLLAENKYLRHQLSTGGSHAVPKVIGESPLMKQILEEVMQVAKSHASVMICGESGTGKEVIAHAIHYNSPRAHRPFIKVNCAAIPESLIESEFFGHEKGAFTGANLKHLGRFELANGGSLLLDEVTEIPLGLQAKLLRVVQEQEFERVGGSKPIKVDVRLISTSNQDVKVAMANKQLREDLYYRLNVVPFYLPPLRERREDIIPLAEYFLEKLCLDNNKPPRKLTDSAKKTLLDYPWPGNIRELANIIERAVVLDSSAYLAAEHLLLDSLQAPLSSQSEGGCSLPVGITLQELEKRLILQTLQYHQHDHMKTAEVLGISPQALHSKIQLYGLL